MGFFLLDPAAARSSTSSRIFTRPLWPSGTTWPGSPGRVTPRQRAPSSGSWRSISWARGLLAKRPARRRPVCWRSTWCRCGMRGFRTLRSGARPDLSGPPGPRAGPSGRRRFFRAARRPLSWDFCRSRASTACSSGAGRGGIGASLEVGGRVRGAFVATLTAALALFTIYMLTWLAPYAEKPRIWATVNGLPLTLASWAG